MSWHAPPHSSRRARLAGKNFSLSSAKPTARRPQSQISAGSPPPPHHDVPSFWPTDPLGTGQSSWSLLSSTLGLRELQVPAHSYGKFVISQNSWAVGILNLNGYPLRFDFWNFYLVRKSVDCRRLLPAVARERPGHRGQGPARHVAQTDGRQLQLQPLPSSLL